MCGICGTWGEPGKAAVESMVGAMSHRGPDDSGVYADPRVALGMTRLAIIDTSASGHQPMSNNDGTIWIVYNGETYNYREEREKLRSKGFVFRSRSDTEVILAMYEEYGDDLLLHMRGMFALALYDKRRGPGRERLLLARDHLGIKPLVYHARGSSLIFASEVKALLASGMVERHFDPESLRLLLTHGSITQPRTAIDGVSMLLPGHRMIVQNGTSKIERYWRLDTDRRNGLRKKPYQEQVEAVRESLAESVRLQMVSDVPIGAFLSGGIDSTFIVALMSQIAGARVRTFSVGFPDEGSEIDETDDAQRAAALLGSEHTRVEVTGEQVLGKIGHIARALDQPSVDGVNSYFVSQAARHGVTVALSGTGGDELFAGYPWFRRMAVPTTNNQPIWKSCLKPFVGMLVRSPLFDCFYPGRFSDMIEGMRVASGFLPIFSRQYMIFGTVGAARVMSPEMRAQSRVGREMSRDTTAADELPFASPIDRVSALCLRGYTQNQLLRDIDAVSMAHSLEVRVPFLDHVLAETALSLPDETKLDVGKCIIDPPHSTYRETGAKRILIEAGKGLLPSDIDLQAKRGFGMPFGAWLRGPLKEVFEETLSEQSVRQRGFFDPRRVDTVRQQFGTGSMDWPFPWLLMIAELWCREVLDRPDVARY